MTKIYFYIFLLSTSFLNVYSQNKDDKHATINDGPYIFIETDKLIQKEIVNCQIVTKELPLDSYQTEFIPSQEVYTKVKKIAALSDIHGQYDLAVKLLLNNEIIDNELNWDFGKGHLVIVGDVFDRGDKVHETLLLIYKLEQQAKANGGKVHFLLGNHEYMILHKDYRYLSKKYEQTSKLLNINYNDLYGKETVLGRWIRSKPTIIKLNDNIFVHGGISKEFLSCNNFNIESINQIMRESIDRDKTEMKSSDFYKTYYGRKSLIWYRGYFRDNLKDKDISKILKKVESEHIIVGHCSHDKIVSEYDGKIYGVDSSIKKGKYGELLMIKKGDYYRKTLKGKKKDFK